MTQPAAIVLAAGDGTRLKSKKPKALHKVCGKPMLQHILDALQALQVSPVVVVVGYAREQIEDYLGDREDVQFAHQADRLGTGHAVLMARPALASWPGDILVLNGDCPLIRQESLDRLLERHRQKDASATLMTAMLDNPAGYGRILRTEDDDVLGIVEHADCNRYERHINEINAGFYCFKATDLFSALDRLQPDNEQGELYLTDVIKILVGDNKRVEAHIVPDASETFGVNNRIQLAEAEQILRRRILDRAMLNGVSVLNPATTVVDDSVVIGNDTDLQPFTLLQGRTTIGSGSVIGPYAHLVDCRVGKNCRLSHGVWRGETIDAETALSGPVLPTATQLDTGNPG